LEHWAQPSPFVFDGPVPPQLVIGRDSEARTLREWARRGRFMAMVAPRRFGKTSLIGKVQVDAAQHDDTVVVVADLFEVASLADLVIRLERAWRDQTPHRTRDAVSRFLAGAEVGASIAGSGFAVRLADRPNIDPLPALHALLDLPRSFSDGGPRALVVLDEFQSVGAIPGAEATIRSHAQHQRAFCSYLFSGSEPGMLAAAFETQARPFYGQVETFRLGRLPAAALAGTIADGFAMADRHPGDVLAGLVNSSEGHPQRAMLLAHLLFQRVAPGARATSADWDAVTAQAMDRVDAEARATLAGLASEQRKILRAVAEYGSAYTARALQSLNLTKSTAQSGTRALVNAGMVERDGGRWRVIDPLLAQWLRSRYGLRP
jgi:hypothetical protein